MNNLVDAYLVYKAKNIEKYVTLLLKNYNQDSTVPDKLRDVIYDYLNEVFLSSEYMSDTELKKITGLKLDSDTNSILELLIEYNSVTRMELAKENIKESYLFIVDAIKFFIRIEGNMNKRGNVSFDFLSSKIMRTIELNNKELLKEQIKKSYSKINDLFVESFKSNSEFNATIWKNSFGVTYDRINDDLFCANLIYQNTLLYSFKEKEVSYVSKNFDIKLFADELELFTVDFIEEKMSGNAKKVFLNIPDYVLGKKTNLNILIDKLHIYSIKKNVILVVNLSTALKHDEFMDLLISNEFTIGINKDMDMPVDYRLTGINYLFLDYFDDDEFKSTYKKYHNDSEFIISNHVTKKEKDACLELGINYFMKK